MIATCRYTGFHQRAFCRHVPRSERSFRVPLCYARDNKQPRCPRALTIHLRQTRSADNACFELAAGAGAGRQRSGSAHATRATVLQLLVAAQRATHDRRARGFAGSVLQVHCSPALALQALAPARMRHQEQSAFETPCPDAAQQACSCSQSVCSSPSNKVSRSR